MLYREGGFGLNFVRGLGIIFCWMALLATLGLASASFLSFPVAAFLSLGVLTLALSSGTMANAVSEGTLMGYNAETGSKGHTRRSMSSSSRSFEAVLEVINLAKDFSPIDSLSTGRSITWDAARPGVRADRAAARRRIAACSASSFSPAANWRPRKERNERQAEKDRSCLLLGGALLVGAWLGAAVAQPRPRPARP